MPMVPLFLVDDLREGDSIDEAAFKALVRAAVAANVAKRAGSA